MKSFIGITGTTCVGKSQVAVHLAKILGTEIISADSMQIYKSMNIGTAKISTAEMSGITHYMLDIVEPNCTFSSFEYQQQAGEIIDKSERPLIVVGGTGFYFDSLLYPPEFGTGDKYRRQELQLILQEQGLSALQEMLHGLDAETYAQIDLNNPVRVMRAVEIAEQGESRANGKGRKQPKYDCKLFVLERERQSLYTQIDMRVDAMVQAGLFAEVENLIEKYGVCDTPAFAAIGYKEIIEYLQGNCSKAEAVEKIKLNTRHYAKRQITYFKKMNAFQHIAVDRLSAEQIAEQIYNFLQN